MDPTLKTYQSDAAFERKINESVDSVADFEEGELNGVEIQSRDVSERSLDFIVPPDSLTPSQQDILDRARQRAQDKGVDLVVKERP